MFVRKKKNSSGSVSVQVVDKSKKYRVVKTIGCAELPAEVDLLMRQGEAFIASKETQLSWIPHAEVCQQGAIENFVSQLCNSQIRTIGPELIFGTLFDRIGFGVIPDQLFRDIVVTRLVHPSSKLKTVDYLYRYRGLETSVDAIYRFLDKLNSVYKEQAEQIAYQHTKAALGGRIAVMFYDMTTLYFESEDEDDLRKIGFSKDGKFQHPQIMLGLLVGLGGRPIGYNIFEGNTFEGKTLLPVLENIKRRYQIRKPVVVADAALLSSKNIEALNSQGYGFIIGARIKNESREVKGNILREAKNLQDGQAIVVESGSGLRLIVTYSKKRATKDQANRKKGIRKLESLLSSGRLTKEHINNRGYNKFLALDGEVRVSLDNNKIKQDELWDGLKGYVTNTTLSPDDVVRQYSQLWQIEKAFRISKTDLRIRPIFHHLRKRIEAHILISFVAYAIYKELEVILEKSETKISPRRAAELCHTMYQLEYFLPQDPVSRKIILKMDEEQQQLLKAISP